MSSRHPREVYREAFLFFSRTFLAKSVSLALGQFSMASFYGGQRSGGRYARKAASTRRYGRSGYNRRRFGKKFAYSRRSYRSGGASSASGGGVRKRLRMLELSNRYGEVQKVSFDQVMPVLIHPEGLAAAQQYFEVPVAAMMRALLKFHGKSVGYLRGVSLEFDVNHALPVDFQLAGFSRPATVGPYTASQFGFETTPFSFNLGVTAGGDAKPRLMTADDDRMRELVTGVFSKFSRDKSFFDADLDRSSPDWAALKHWDVRRNKGSVFRFKSGIASLRLNARPIDGSGVGPMVKETVRLYGHIDSSIRAVDTEPGVVLFGGIRSDCPSYGAESPRMGKGVNIPVGTLQDARLVLYCRY